MPLKIFSKLVSSSSRDFLNLAIRRGLIKVGFEKVLADKTLQQIEQYLLDKKILTENQILELYSQFYRLPIVRLVERPIDLELVKLIPRKIAEQYLIAFYNQEGLDLYLAVGKPSFLQKNAPDVLVKLRSQKGLRIHLAITPKTDITTLLNKVYPPKISSSREIPKHSIEKDSQSNEKDIAISTESKKPTLEPPTEKKKLTAIQDAHNLTYDQKSSREHLPSEAKMAGDKQPPVISKTTLTKPTSTQLKSIDLNTIAIDPQVLNRIPYQVAKKYRLVVFAQEKPTTQFEPPLIKVALAKPNDPHVKDILSFIEERNQVLVDKYVTSDIAIEKALEQYPQYKKEQEETRTRKLANIFSDKSTQQASEQLTKQVGAGQLKANQSSSAQLLTEKSRTGGAPGGTATQPTIAPSDQVYTLSSDDIINRPEESVEDLKELARAQANSLEEQNLDSLLQTPVTSVDELAKVIKKAMIPEIVAGTLFLAIRMKASDVHIEPIKDHVRFRYRIDGILHEIIDIPIFLLAPLVSRIKILSRMKIDEQRVPQDGRFDVIIDNRQVDLRVSTLPTVHGEKVVMRLLDKTQGIMTLEQLGVTGSNFDRLVTNINKPYGVILSTGPTGSGKTTTLYAILNRISKPGVNIITLEDPVEYELEGINQSQVRPQIGFSFADGMRSVLRQDPNIIMVGEIRDLETAAMATHAALTGHLVISTLHTNDSSGALPRLINMGVEPFLITSSMNCVIGQRLVRRLCDHCKEKANIPEAVLKFIKRELEEVPTGQLKGINTEQLIFYHGKGCEQCTDGYRGRIGIFEVLVMSEKIEDLAVSKAPASEIKKAAIKEGMTTMMQDGIIKAIKGITTLDEVMRVTTTSIKEVPSAK